MNIPLVDLQSQYRSLKGPIDKAVLRILSQGNFVFGQELDDFEKQFAKYCGVKYCVGVASGSDALLLSLRALGVGSGDEVIVPANTFISTVLPVVYLGARPVLVDVDPRNYQTDPEKVGRAITSKTKVIIPVHLYGYPAPMDQILKIARKNKIAVLEDACQAHGSSLAGRRCGSLGHVAAFSFYPAKNLGAAGDGGAVSTNDKRIAQGIRQMRNIGQVEKYKHDVIGYNSRLDTVQAALLAVKLKYLDKWNRKRRRAAAWYSQLLSGVKEITLPPKEGPREYCNFHLYIVRAPKRDKMLKFLRSRGVGAGIHYPIPVHMQNSLAFLNYKKGDFPVTESYAKEIISLPIYPEMTKLQVRFVCDQIKEFFRK